MTVTKAKATVAELESEVEAWLDSMDSADSRAREGKHMRRIAAARKRVLDAERNLGEAVAAARADGDTWAMIGVALGTTRQAAFQRFGGRFETPPPRVETTYASEDDDAATDAELAAAYKQGVAKLTALYEQITAERAAQQEEALAKLLEVYNQQVRARKAASGEAGR